MRFLESARPAIRVAGDLLIVSGDSPPLACLVVSDTELEGDAPGRHAQLLCA